MGPWAMIDIDTDASPATNPPLIMLPTAYPFKGAGPVAVVTFETPMGIIVDVVSSRGGTHVDCGLLF